MTKFEEMKPNDSASLIRRIEALERQVQQAGAARRLESATIGRGGITVQGGAIILRDTDGHEIARMGVRDDLLPEPDGDSQPGFILRRNDGSVAFTLDDPEPDVDGYRQVLKMQDAQGNIIFLEDYHGGWGLASPTFTSPLYPTGGGTSWTQWPLTTNTVFEELWAGYYPAWNPVVSISAQGTCATLGATGELRLLVNGIAQSPVLALAYNTWNSQNWTVDLSTIVGATNGTAALLSIQARRVAGTGNVHVAPVWAIGYPSTVLP